MSSSLESILSGKRVALVAPGAQTEIMNLGSEIDSYDIVARVGNYCPLNEDEVGSRTDILMENFWFWDNRYQIDRQGMYDEWLRQGVEHVRYVWPNSHGLDNFKGMNQDRLEISYMSDEHQRGVRNIVGSPTKGLCALYDLLHQPVAELFVVGYSFSKAFGYRKDCMMNPYRLPSCDDQYIDPNESANNFDRWAANLSTADHKFKEEFDWFRGVRDPRLKLDPWLEKLCE